MEMTYFSPDLTEFLNIAVMALIAVASVAACFAAYKILNAVPAKWLCDYDEEPGEELLGIRYKFKQSGIYTSALFAILNAVCFSIFGLSYLTAFILIISFVLLLITLSDAKFSIIPDQFVVALAVVCFVFAVTDMLCYKVFIGNVWDILLGAVCGGGFLFIINILSILIFKKEGMGFGDVKLMLALGACLGFPRIFGALLVAVAVAFVYILFLLIKRIFSKNDGSNYFPFGPFLCIGSLVSLIFAEYFDAVVVWYLSLLTI